MDFTIWYYIILCMIFLGIVFYLSIIILKHLYKYIKNIIKWLISYFSKYPKVFIGLCTTVLVITGILLIYQYYLYQDKQNLIAKGYCYETRTKLTDRELYKRAMLDFLYLLDERNARLCKPSRCGIFITKPLTAEELFPFYQKYYKGTKDSSEYIDFSYDDIPEKFEFLKDYFGHSWLKAIQYLIALNAKVVDESNPINNPIFFEPKNNRWTVIFSFSGYLYVLPKDCCAIVDAKTAVQGWGSKLKVQYGAKYLQMHIAWGGDSSNKIYFPYLIDSCGYLMENPFKSED